MRISPLALAVLLLAACRTTPPVAPAVATKPQPAPVASPTKLEAPTVRLPPGARPLDYELSLRVVPGEPTFGGEVTIALELERPLEVLWLNARDLDVRSAVLEVGAERVAAEPRLFPEHFLAVVLPKPLGPGRAALTLTFAGVLSAKDNDGLFQIKEGSGSYAFSFFEPISARRAFPCFDEPSYKSSWHLTLHVKQEHLALHNTPVESERDEGEGMKAVTFARTPPLSSYLVALAVGPFEIADAGTWGQKRTRIRIITPRGKQSGAKLAAAVTGPILEQAEAYFGTAYPFEKLDQVAVPGSTAAMEHPGLVTYGAWYLLSEPEKDTIDRERAFAATCAHELAHMWFGNLVTMAWWDDLWLNEAFSTWIASSLIERWKPAWEEDVERALVRGSVLSKDSLLSARRVRQPISSMDDIVAAFDDITYEKGAAVIGMIEAYVGAEVMQRAVRRHLADHAWKNTTARDFIGAVSREAGRDLGPVFDSFLDQGGAPRVTLDLECRPGAAPVLHLAQRRQLPLGSRGAAAATAQVWKVPLCVRYAEARGGRRACTLLEAPEAALSLEGQACPAWVLPNDSMRGYFRASLRGELSLPRLLEVAWPNLTSAERVGLFGDLRAQVSSGEVELGAALATLPIALRDGNRYALEAAMDLATNLRGDVLSPALRPKYEQFLRSVFGARALALGFEVPAKEDDSTRLLRPQLLWLVGRLGREPTLRAKSLALAKSWLDDRGAIHPDLVATVLRIAADTDDTTLHASLLSAVLSEPDREDRAHLLTALGNFRAPALVERHLLLTLDERLDPREGLSLLWAAGWDFRSRELGLGFLRRHWEALIARLPTDTGADLVRVAAGACDETERDAVKTFFDGRSTKFLGGQRQLDETMEAIDLCIAWRARHRPSAAQFIERWTPPSARP